jgi:DNA repair protein RecO (recombination protein O)
MSATVDRVEMEAAFLLHSRPWRETSRIIEAFSQRHGRVGLIANGAMRPKSRWRSVLRPFQPLRVSWSGRGSLYTLRSAEPSSRPFDIKGLSLMSAYYLNELLLKLMERGDAHADLFAHYAATLDELAIASNAEPVLRRFEVLLLAEIGYGLSLDEDVIEHLPLQPERRYEYVIEQGPVPVDGDYSGELVFNGADLIAIGRGECTTDLQLRNAKRLLRPVLNLALGGKTLRTREVLASMLR